MWNLPWRQSTIACFAVVASLILTISCDAQLKSTEWPGEQSLWNGYAKFDFEVDERSAYVVQPKHPAPGNPWVWRARFPGYHPEIDLLLLERGFHIARIDTDGMLGSPNAMKHWDAFYHFLVDRGLAERAALEGVSRGGLFVYRFASQWPERVACIYGDTPVCDIRSWPGGKGSGRGHQPTWQSCLKEYGLTEQSSAEYRGNPIDILQPIADAKIPLLHIVSLNDVIVPPTENTFVLEQRFKALGGKIGVIKVGAGTEQSGGHHFDHPDPLRVADFIELHSTVLPQQRDYFELRGGLAERGPLDNCRIKFETTKKGRVAFMGGSITAMKGWRDLTKSYLQEKFPETEFEFIDAGISSTGSTPGAFRLQRDVLSKGNVDLFFEEAAVNDLHNMRTPQEMIRGMEGIVRHARKSNPKMDIVIMHFVDPNHMSDYRNGKIPETVSQHERVAQHYQVASIHLAKEITERIDSQQFDWEHDFKNLHPSPFGHRVYAATIRRMLAAAWDEPLKSNPQPVIHDLPEAIDRYSYANAGFLPLEQVTEATGFELDTKCDPRANGIGGGVREGFHAVPMLVGQSPGDSLKFGFSGRAVGLFVAAGPDAGIIEYSIDGERWQTLDLFTKWSKGLHIPWVYILENELDRGEHRIEIRIAAKKNEASKGHACRIVHLLVNE